MGLLVKIIINRKGFSLLVCIPEGKPDGWVEKLKEGTHTSFVLGYDIPYTSARTWVNSSGWFIQNDHP